MLWFVLSDGAPLSRVSASAAIVPVASPVTVMATLLFGIGVHDPLTFAAVGALLLVASLIPARRATHVDPVIALKNSEFGIWN